MTGEKYHQTDAGWKRIAHGSARALMMERASVLPLLTKSPLTLNVDRYYLLLMIRTLLRSLGTMLERFEGLDERTRVAMKYDSEMRMRSSARSAHGIRQFEPAHARIRSTGPKLALDTLAGPPIA